MKKNLFKQFGLLAGLFFTLQPGAQVWAASAFTQIPASNYAAQSGIQLEASIEGGQNVAFIDNGDYTSYNSIEFAATGAASFSARVASNASGGAIEIRTGSATGALAGTCTVPVTGGWQNWTTVSCPVTGLSNTHTIFLRYTGGAGNLFNIRWFSFTAPTPPAISAFTQIEAENFTSQSGIQTETSTEAGQNVGWIENGDYLHFAAINFANGTNSFTARVASASPGGTIEIRTGSATGTLRGSCNVPSTSGWQNWTSITCPISTVTGTQSLYLRFVGNGSGLFNINWFRFSAPQTSSDVVGKITVGYQGWFNAQGDGSPFGCWFHWSNNCNAPTPNTNVKFELYPDTREYSKLYQSNLANLANGTPARLFSSYDQSTVNKHFEWMQTYNIDTAALQRFGATVSSAADGYRDNRDSVATKVKIAAEAHARKFYVMYDITGLNSDWVSAIKSDWTNNVVNKLQLTYSNAYARQDGKIVVCIWGLGFTHTPGTAEETLELINWFKNQNIYVIGGVPTYWRTGQANSDAKPGFIDAFKALNMVSPWLVGRFDINGVDHFKNNVFPADVTFAQQNNLVYQPVLFPGFAWSNMYPNNPRNQIPRVHGDFMWKQAYIMKSLGVNTAYVAMFDEYDEGTAIAKAAENQSMVPTNQYFLTLDADGVALSADFYLRLTNDIGRLMKGEIALTVQHPTTHLN